MKKLLIFDFDGTLFDTVDDVVICFNKALTIHEFPALTHDEYIERLGGNIDEIVSLILKEKNTPENIDLIKNTYQKLYNSSQKTHSLPFPKIHETLKELQDNGMLVAINSNRTTDSIKNFVNRYLGDIDFLDIEGHNPDYPSKPSPVGVNNLIRKANVARDEAIYIGDSETDIKTAKNAGIDCVIVKWGYGGEKDYCDGYPIGVIDDVCQLMDLI
ncbi:HAD family hydrolase [Methanobrevibacter sp.]|uniref:HAD family hydrolase n=1 Tax=Methanobrevibacter sp. TaxID=66852 RepID=UPI0026E0F47D|nr:HAD family hydrolase [Methanobrevibacter sp.]MDO5859188.1 HAD family hydrolase [Methanobrevibacter sp.]